ncbi:hypothetical protein A2U01_0095779, partial [Trifolium medium]|nr:hypothetical protein [Trifolium medium]
REIGVCGGGDAILGGREKDAAEINYNGIQNPMVNKARVWCRGGNMLGRARLCQA